MPRHFVLTGFSYKIKQGEFELKIVDMLKLVFVVVVVFTLGIICAVTISLNLNNKQTKSIQTQILFERLGLELLSASDLLTSEAKSYVQYGDKKHYDAYFKEINETKTRERVIENLRRLGAPQNEIDLVESARQRSVYLEQIELKAFAEVEKGNMEKARVIMFGDEYNTYKQNIVELIKKFQAEMEQRCNNEVDEVKKIC